MWLLSPKIPHEKETEHLVPHFGDPNRVDFSIGVMDYAERGAWTKSI